MCILEKRINKWRLINLSPLMVLTLHQMIIGSVRDVYFYLCLTIAVFIAIRFVKGDISND